MQHAIKYFTRETLIQANREAVRTGRNRSLPETVVSNLPDAKYPVTMALLHNDSEIRAVIVLSADGDLGYIDIPFDTYNHLPEILVEDNDGSLRA